MKLPYKITNDHIIRAKEYLNKIEPQKSLYNYFEII